MCHQPSHDFTDHHGFAQQTCPLHSLLARLATKLRATEAAREVWLGAGHQLLYQQFMMGKHSIAGRAVTFLVYSVGPSGSHCPTQPLLLDISLLVSLEQERMPGHTQNPAHVTNLS